MRLTKSISDTIYGRIDLSETEFRLLQSPLLQRLRQVAQTPAACLVFPSATHNRFSHSLGCLYMMDKMARALEVEEADLRWLRAAALLHDVGHFPLSHTGEIVYGALGGSHSDVISEPVELPDDPFIWAAQLGKPTISHEQVSKQIVETNPGILQILHTSNLPVHSISNLIVGGLTGGPDAALFNLMMRSDLDADRMDYLVRDATLVGAKYGIIDADYLLTSLKSVSVGSAKQLAVALSGLHSLEHALLSRFFMYCNVFFHKAVYGFDLLMRATMRTLIERGGAWPQSIEEVTTIAAQTEDGGLSRFADHLFWADVTQACQEQSLTRRTKLCRMLAERNPPRCAYVAEHLSSAGHLADWRELTVVRDLLGEAANKRRLAKTAGVPPDDITMCLIPISLPKNDDTSIQVVDTQAATWKPVALSDLTSSLLATHVGQTLYRLHVYVLEDPPQDKMSPTAPRNIIRKRIERLLSTGKTRRS